MHKVSQTKTNTLEASSLLSDIKIGRESLDVLQGQQLLTWFQSLFITFQHKICLEIGPVTELLADLKLIRSDDMVMCQRGKWELTVTLSWQKQYNS